MTFFYFKILGGVLVVMSGSGLGYLYGQDMIKRYKELLEIKRSFRVIYGDISYGGMSLGEIFSHVKKQCMKEHKEWFTYLEVQTKETQNKSFAKLWETSIEKHLILTCLSRGDKEALVQVGKTLGTVDKKQQLALISLYLETLDGTILAVAEEKDKRRKMCNVLGVIGSLFIVVFLM